MRELRALTERYTQVRQETGQRADFRAGQICALLANINRDLSKRPLPFEPADFFPSLGDVSTTPQAASGENAILNNMMLLASAVGATVVENG
jgi:hypothetical protein